MWKRPFVIVSCSCQKVLVSTSSSNHLLECSGWLEEFLVATNQECCRRRHAGRWLPFSNASLVNVSTLSWAIPNWLTTASSSNNLFPLNDKQNVLQIYFLYIKWHHQSPAKYPHYIYISLPAHSLLRMNATKLYLDQPLDITDWRCLLHDNIYISPKVNINSICLRQWTYTWAPVYCDRLWYDKPCLVQWQSTSPVLRWLDSLARFPVVHGRVACQFFAAIRSLESSRSWVSAGQESGELMMMMMMLMIHNALYTCSKRKRGVSHARTFSWFSRCGWILRMQREKVHELYQLVHHRDHGCIPQLCHTWNIVSHGAPLTVVVQLICQCG